MSEITLLMHFRTNIRDVFEAFSRSDKLTGWFSESAEISIDDGRYDFWGKRTPEAPSRNDGRHALTAFKTEKLIEYNWNVRGSDSTVRLEFALRGSGTDVTLYHTGLPDLKPSESSIGDFWAMVLEGLRGWLEIGRRPHFLDYSSPPRGDVRLSVEIDVPPEMVFRALTEPEYLNPWIAKDSKVDPRPGGQMGFGWGGGSAQNNRYPTR